MRKISVVFHPASGPAVDQGADRVPAFESRVDIGFRNLYLKDMYLDLSVCRLDYLHLLLGSCCSSLVLGSEVGDRHLAGRGGTSIAHLVPDDLAVLADKDLLGCVWSGVNALGCYQFRFPLPPHSQGWNLRGG